MSILTKISNCPDDIKNVIFTFLPIDIRVTIFEDLNETENLYKNIIKNNYSLESMYIDNKNFIRRVMMEFGDEEYFICSGLKKFLNPSIFNDGVISRPQVVEHPFINAFINVIGYNPYSYKHNRKIVPEMQGVEDCRIKVNGNFKWIPILTEEDFNKVNQNNNSRFKRRYPNFIQYHMTAKLTTMNGYKPNIVPSKLISMLRMNSGNDKLNKKIYNFAFNELLSYNHHVKKYVVSYHEELLEKKRREEKRKEEARESTELTRMRWAEEDMRKFMKKEEKAAKAAAIKARKIARVNARELKLAMQEQRKAERIAAKEALRLKRIAIEERKAARIAAKEAKEQAKLNKIKVQT